MYTRKSRESVRRFMQDLGQSQDPDTGERFSLRDPHELDPHPGYAPPFDPDLELEPLDPLPSS